MTIGSLFDGSGGFPLAATMCGITPVWASEVEPYPIAVTKSRFPSMKHLGDISKINGAEIEPVDIISFGSPCQDLSVAGKRAGLKHEDNGDDETTRSGLFMEAIRIIKEMREATNGRYPTFALWENVPGAFSSNGGEDFRTVLEELIRIAEPSAVMPTVPQKGWAYADCYCSDGWSIAYRVLDAQFWGVPQRRRRIYLVLDLGGERAGKILFKSEGLQRNPAEGRTPWQGIAEDAQRRVRADDRTGENVVVGFDGYNGDITGDVSATLGVNCDRATGRNGVIEQRLYQPKSLREENWAESDVRNALRAGESKVGHAIVEAAGFKELNSAKARSDAYGYEVAPCLAADKHDASVCYGISAYESNAMKSANPHSGIYEAKTSRTLDLNGGNPACNQGGIAVVQTYDARGNGDGAVCNTITGDHENRVTDYTSVVVKAIGNGQADQLGLHDIVGALNCMHDQQAVLYRQGSFADYVEGECGTLKASGGDLGGGSENLVVSNTPRYIVRRLTPTECARLQGFPDKWGHPDQKDSFTDEEYAFWTEVRVTHAVINGKQPTTYSRDQMVKWYNKLHTDGAEYKMWGNGIALPCALHVMSGIAEVMGERT